MMRECFLDTSYLIALINPRDEYHPQVVELEDYLRTQMSRIVTTTQVIIEFCNALARHASRQEAVEVVEYLEADRLFEILPFDHILYQQGFSLFKERADKNWSLTDCISFVIMRQRRISLALTTDRHFRQAGFVPLLTALESQ